MAQYRVDFESIAWEIPTAGIRFKAHEQKGKRLRLVEFAKDFVELDWCINGHIGLILEGQIEDQIQDKSSAILFRRQSLPLENVP